MKRPDNTRSQLSKALAPQVARTVRALIAACAPCLLLMSAASCGDDDGGGPNPSPAQRSGVGAACTVGVDTDCLQDVAPLKCLNFKGGYCGLEGCTRAEDCPIGSACVAHDDGKNYCFLVCIDKPDCNLTRAIDSEANCSSSISFLGGASGGKKACVPPS